jgi:hypothetical protein
MIRGMIKQLRQLDEEAGWSREIGDWSSIHKDVRFTWRAGSVSMHSACRLPGSASYSFHGSSGPDQATQENGQRSASQHCAVPLQLLI